MDSGCAPLRGRTPVIDAGGNASWVLARQEKYHLGAVMARFVVPFHSGYFRLDSPGTEDHIGPRETVPPPVLERAS